MQKTRASVIEDALSRTISCTIRTKNVFAASEHDHHHIGRWNRDAGVDQQFHSSSLAHTASQKVEYSFSKRFVWHVKWHITDSLHRFTLFLTDSLEKCQTKSFENEYSTFCNFQILYHKSTLHILHYWLVQQFKNLPQYLHVDGHWTRKHMIAVNSNDNVSDYMSTSYL